jgi:hypothetical protein
LEHPHRLAKVLSRSQSLSDKVNRTPSPISQARAGSVTASPATHTSTVSHSPSFTSGAWQGPKSRSSAPETSSSRSVVRSERLMQTPRTDETLAQCLLPGQFVYVATDRYVQSSARGPNTEANPEPCRSSLAKSQPHVPTPGDCACAPAETERI